MPFLNDIRMYGRFALGLRGFLRHIHTLEEAQAMIRQNMARRESRFLRLVERGVFSYPRSPYLPLLRNAGCELGDIHRLVHSEGIEGTLRLLRQNGVYVTFEEFKGREPIVRGGAEVAVQRASFDNPFLKHYYEAETGGTTGAGTRVAIDLDHLAAQAPHIMVTRAAHGVLDVPTALWYGILPGHAGIGVLLRQARFGRVAERWFSPIAARDIRFSPKNRLATLGLVSLSRVFGRPLPRPEFVSLSEAGRIARWAVRRRASHGQSLVRTSVSLALRICVAAREEGLDLGAVTFMGGSEPPTPAKVQAITSSGAGWIPTYFFAEAGAVALGCANPTDGNDLHLLQDCLALIQHPRQVPGTQRTVEAFHWTSLLPTTPKIMLNVESDDYGTIEDRSCGCPLEELGFGLHLREVRSFGKLTGEGVTLVGSEMIHVLEQVLPARFGGGPLDYQLIEEEDERGFTRVTLLVSPRVPIADERAVVPVVLEALGRGSDSADLTRALWAQAGSLQVRRQEPVWTSRGKLMPLHVIRNR